MSEVREGQVLFSGLSLLEKMVAYDLGTYDRSFGRPEGASLPAGASEEFKNYYSDGYNYRDRPVVEPTYRSRN